MEQLNQIQRIVLRNDLEAKNIQEQSEIVREAANNAHDSAIKVRDAHFSKKELFDVKAHFPKGTMLICSLLEND